MSLATPSKAELAYMGACKRLGCTVCINEGLGNTPADFHHMLSPGGRRISHMMGFGLCPTHHDSGINNKFSVSRHPWKRAFEKRYGSEHQLLQKTREMLGPVYAIRADGTAVVALMFVSLNTKIEQLQGLVGTTKLGKWETRFVEDARNFLPPGQVTAMSEKQVGIVERIWARHFS